MMPRKKRLAIIISIVTLMIILIVGILAFLYIKTDAFKTNARSVRWNPYVWRNVTAYWIRSLIKRRKSPVKSRKKPFF